VALKDHYAKKASKHLDSATGDPDSWALEYIAIGHKQSILEAFDEDYSGFVTVDEVGRFTQSRPSDWRHAIFLGFTRFTCSPTSQRPALDSLLGDR
jgi:hypothetical protein